MVVSAHHFLAVVRWRKLAADVVFYRDTLWTTAIMHTTQLIDFIRTSGTAMVLALHCIAWRGVAWRGVGLHAGEPPSMEEEAAELFYELEQAVRLD